MGKHNASALSSGGRVWRNRSARSALSCPLASLRSRASFFAASFLCRRSECDLVSDPTVAARLLFWSSTT
eukprot:3937721-Rhodomonas_salina.1